MTYFIQLKDQKKTFKTIPDEAYILSGFKNLPDAGKVYLSYFGDEGTCLYPLLDSKDGSQVRIDNPIYYGQEYGKIPK